MNKIYLPLFLFSLCFAACNQEEIDYKRPDLYNGAMQSVSDFNLVGNIKDIQIVNVDNQTDLSDLENFDWDSQLENSNFAKFDTKGRLTSEYLTERYEDKRWQHCFYNKEGLLYHSKLGKTSINYIYNDNDQLIEIQYSNGNRTKLIHGKNDKEDEYKAISYITKEVYPSESFTPSSRKVYLFDTKGRVVTVKDGNDRNLISYQGNMVIDSLKKYNDNVYSFKDIQFENGKIVNSKTHRLLSEEERINDVVTFYMYKEKKYKFNSKGDLIFTEVMDKNNTDNNDKYTFEYKYDGEGNWIIRNAYKKNIPYKTTIRKISYYKKRYFGILK